MAAQKHNTASQGVAVRVSHRMQLAFIGVAALSVALNLAFALSLLELNKDMTLYRSGPFMYAVSSLFPVLVFLVAYFTGGVYRTVLNRIFIAGLKAFIIVAILTFLQGLRNYVTFYLYQPGNDIQVPPAWLTSLVVDYVFMGVVLVGMLAVIFGMRRLKGGRG